MQCSSSRVTAAISNSFVARHISSTTVVDTHLPRFEAIAYVLPHFPPLLILPKRSTTWVNFNYFVLSLHIFSMVRHCLCFVCDSWCKATELCSSAAVVPQSKSTELCDSAAVVRQSKSTELCNSVVVVPQSKSTELCSSAAVVPQSKIYRVV